MPREGRAGFRLVRAARQTRSRPWPRRIAGSMYISGTNYPIYPNGMPQAGIQIKADRSGVVTIFTGGNDIGQGSNSVVAYLVAEELGLELDAVRVIAADTDLCPVDLGAYSSRVTFMVGNAAIDAARKLRKQVVPRPSRRSGKWTRPGCAWWAVSPSTWKGQRAAHRAAAFQIAEARFDTLGALALQHPAQAGTTAAARSARRRHTPSPRTSSRWRWTRAGRITVPKVTVHARLRPRPPAPCW
ncbi:MAG: molybdopterin cofactor-binding domain-containing protein [Planctomycetota bacterium]